MRHSEGNSIDTIVYEEMRAAVITTLGWLCHCFRFKIQVDAMREEVAIFGLSQVVVSLVGLEVMVSAVAGCRCCQQIQMPPMAMAMVSMFYAQHACCISVYAWLIFPPYLHPIRSRQNNMHVGTVQIQHT